MPAGFYAQKGDTMTEKAFQQFLINTYMAWEAALISR
jgi:hypothetical protein